MELFKNIEMLMFKSGFDQGWSIIHTTYSCQLISLVDNFKTLTKFQILILLM